MNLTIVAITSLVLAGLCALVIALDELRHPQPMVIMNVVWPVSALYFSVFGLWAYFALGRQQSASKGQMSGMHEESAGENSDPPRHGEAKPPTAAQVAVGTSHCGAGCTLADVGTEFAIAGTGLVWFGSILWTEYLLDFIVAWALGILFQYFAIRPMRQDLSPAATLGTAVKADTLSILAFQIGMYLWMALVFFKLFPAPHHLTPFDPRYWLMMQIAMVCGFLTSFPMNRWLIGKGLKEAM